MRIYRQRHVNFNLSQDKASGNEGLLRTCSAVNRQRLRKNYQAQRQSLRQYTDCACLALKLQPLEEVVVTLIALYSNIGDAGAAATDLVQHGFEREDISVVTEGYFATAEPEEDAQLREPGESPLAADFCAIFNTRSTPIPGPGPTSVAGPLMAAITRRDLAGGLQQMGLPKPEARRFEHAVHTGGALVTIQVKDTDTTRAALALEHHHPVDLEMQTQTDTEKPAAFQPHAVSASLDTGKTW